MKYLTKEERQTMKDIKAPYSKPEIVLEILAAVGLLVTFIYILLKYSTLPATIPIHFNFDGAADSWGSKASILFLPAVSVFLYVLMTIAGFFPQYFNYAVKVTPENVERQFKIARAFMAVLKIVFVWFFFYLTQITIQAGLGAVIGLTPMMFAFLFLLVVAIGLMIYFSLKNK
jgi:uncharacterized membrane protein